MDFLKKLFAKRGQQVIEDVIKTVENNGDTFVDGATNIVKNEIKPTFNCIKGLKEELDKIGLGIRKCLENRPGFRKYELIDGTTLTVSSEPVHNLATHSTTLKISRDIVDPRFWEKYRCTRDTDQFIPDFLGARRDYLWGSDGLTKATSVQTTYLSKPEHVGRTLYTAVDIGDIPALPKVTTKTSIIKIPSDMHKYDIQWLDHPYPEYYGGFGRRIVTKREKVLDIHNERKPLYTGTKYYNNYEWMHNPNIGRFGEL